MEQIKRLSTNVGARPSNSRSMWDLPHGTSAFAQVDPNANTSRYRGGETSSLSPYGVEDRRPVRSSSWLPDENPRLGIPIAKWRLKRFDGQEEEWMRFLVTIKQYAIAEGATEADLFRNRIYLFTGNAADFLALNPGLRDWVQLVQEMTRWVRGSNSDYDRLRQLEKKRQGPKESSSLYLLRMEMLFRNLNHPIPFEDQRDIVLRGFRPEIRATLSGYVHLRSIDELRMAAQQVERVSQGMRPYASLNEISSLEENCDALEQKQPSKGRYRRGTPRNAKISETPDKPKGLKAIEAAPTDVTQAGRLAAAFCFRCGEIGHYRIHCRAEKSRKFCYGCGRDDTLSKDCPDCSENGPRRLQ